MQASLEDDADGEEEKRLRSVAIQNANTILLARRRAEQELLATQEALRETSQRLTSILESITDGFMVLDREWRCTYLNQRAEEVIRPLQKSRVNLIGRNFWEEFPDLAGTELEKNYRRAMNEQVTVEFETYFPTLDRWLEIRAYPAKDVLSLYFQDNTRRKSNEQALRESETRERAARADAERASAMKDEFLATLSHELRTPLSAILGWTQLLRRGAVGKAELEQGLETIERNARVQTQLIEDLLDMSRITSGKVRLDIQPVDPVIAIEAAIETVRPAANAKGIKLEKLLDPAAGPVAGDPSRLQQIVWNLLSNAIKFTPKGGTVRVLLQRTGSHVELSVIDTGIGLRPEFLPHVFERFRQADATTTRSYSGLGLGLAIVKHLVELHGGTVRVESPGEGKGSTFAVQFPLTTVNTNLQNIQRISHAESKPASLDFRQTDLSGIKVLVVDDESDARDLIKRVLGECGAQVLLAAGADEALVLVETERPHVLVSDIGMPDVDGFELLGRVRAFGEARGGNLPAIALTAFARSEDRTRALRLGFRVHVSKPVEPAELVATVANVAGRTGER